MKEMRLTGFCRRLLLGLAFCTGMTGLFSLIFPKSSYAAFYLFSVLSLLLQQYFGLFGRAGSFLIFQMIYVKPLTF